MTRPILDQGISRRFRESRRAADFRNVIELRSSKAPRYSETSSIAINQLFANYASGGQAVAPGPRRPHLVSSRRGWLFLENSTRPDGRSRCLVATVAVTRWIRWRAHQPGAPPYLTALVSFARRTCPMLFPAVRRPFPLRRPAARPFNGNNGTLSSDSGND